MPGSSTRIGSSRRSSSVRWSGAVALITVFTDRRRDTPMLIAAVVAGVLVIVQSLLGAAVVLQGLAAELVTAHLAMALTVFACDDLHR